MKLGWNPWFPRVRLRDPLAARSCEAATKRDTEIAHYRSGVVLSNEDTGCFRSQFVIRDSSAVSLKYSSAFDLTKNGVILGQRGTCAYMDCQAGKNSGE